MDAPTSPPISELRQVTTPAALALADLAEIFEELQTVLRCCERLLTDLAAPGQGDPLVVEALWTTAVLSYARCFAAGARGQGLTTEDLAQTRLAGDVTGWHRVLGQMREHYADPAVNPRERFCVAAARAPSGTVNGIALTSVRQPQVDQLTVRQTGAIAYQLSRLVDERITERQQGVLTAAQALPAAELARLTVLPVNNGP